MRRSLVCAWWVVAPLGLWGCSKDRPVDAKSDLARANDRPIEPALPQQVRPPDPVKEPLTAQKVERYLEFQDAFTPILAEQVALAQQKTAVARADGSREAKTKLDAELETMQAALSARRIAMLQERGLTDLEGRQLSGLVGEMAALKITLDPALVQLQKARSSMGMLPESQRGELEAQLKERQRQLEATGRMAHSREVLGDEAVEAMLKRRDAAIQGYEKQLVTRGTFALPGAEKPSPSP